MQITIWPNLNADNPGKCGEVSWERLCTFLNSPIEFRGTFETPGWSCAQFENNHRSIEEVILVYALCLDFDKGKAPRSVIEALFGRYRYASHASKSNSDAEPRYRVAIALSRPVSGAEYYRVWRVFTKEFNDRCDISTKDPSRFWFCPCKTESTKWEFWQKEGKEIDVDALLLEADELEKRESDAMKRRAEQLRANSLNERDGDLTLRRASAYLARMDSAIQGSNGSLALWQAALVMVRGFSLVPSQALALLESEYNPRCVPPWTQRELIHKVSHASKANRMKHPDGWLLNSGNNFKRIEAGELPEEPPPFDGEVIEVADLDAEVESPEITAVVNKAKELRATEIQQTAAERFGAYSAQRLSLDVLADVSKQPDPGCPIGIGDIDEAMGGVRRQMVGTLGGSTSFGKTTLGMLCVNETCKVKKRPLVLTFEDAPLLYGRKLVASRGKINATAIRDRKLTALEFKEVARVVSEADTLPLLINCIGKTVEYAVAAIREIVPSEGIDIVIVDYLQRIRTEKRTQDRRNEVTYVAGSLSDAIKTANCGGIMLSQLKRLDGREPEMDDLKESGDIECFSEFVILGWRNKIAATNTEAAREEKFCKLAKSKDGITLLEPIRLRWNCITASFEFTPATENSQNRQVQQFDRDSADFDNSIAGYE